MKYLILLVKYRKSQSSFLVVFLAFLLTSCGGEENSFSTKQTGSFNNIFKATIDAKGVRIDFSSLQNITDITRITIDYSTDELREEFNRGVDTNVKNDNFSTSASFYTLPRVIIKDKLIKYSYLVSVYRNNNLYAARGGVFSTPATQPPVIISGFDNITFDFASLENPENLEWISIEYTTSTADQPKKYDSSVDTQNNDVTKDTSYILPNLTPGTTYYYRFTAYRGNFEQIDVSDTVTKTIRPPNITSGFDNVTFDFASLDTPVDIDRISIEYTASQAFANAKEYDLSVDSNKGNFSTSDNNYILRRVIDNTRYYYRFTVYRGKLEQVSTGDVATKMTHAPVITSDFDRITFDFTNLENPADIDRISIEYTTSKVFADAKEYDLSVDSSKGDFSTSANNYILKRVIDNTRYYYRFTAYRGLAQQVLTGDVATKMTRAPVITSGFDSITFDFTSLENLADIDRISIEYTTSQASADAKEYDFSVDTRHNDVTKDTPYILPNLTPDTTYHYRIVVKRGEARQVVIDNFSTSVVDSNGNGLIEISTLTQLHNIRYNLKGTSYKTDDSDASSASGCPRGVCRGYELTKSLDFDKNNSGSTWSTSDNNGTIKYTLDQGDNVEPYFVVNSGGWEPIGDNTNSNTSFDAIFDGNNHTISSLAIRKDLQYLGMFGATGASADIRNLGLLANLADYTGASNDAIYIGGLVGRQYRGNIAASYTKGNVAGGAGNDDRVGGLVGLQTGGSITASYATGNTDGGAGSDDRVGGLVGLQTGGSITASYATGNTDGGAGIIDYVGGLVGEQSGGSITASYATGNTDGGAGGIDYVGGLVGFQFRGSITASYATGNTDGGDGYGDIVGGLLGLQFGGSITDSYATGSADGGVGNSDFVGGLVGEQSGGRITASYAIGNADGGAGDDDRVGGLVGNQNGSIIASYATGNTDGGAGDDDRVGGLVGNQNGSIIASYATGNTDGGAGDGDRVGGLVGYQNGSITASYATGNTDGGAGIRDRVGGLVGYQNGSITASYATGNTDGGDGTSDRVGGLVGYQNGIITASYATGNTDGGDGASDRVGGLVGDQNGIITASYATGNTDGGAGIVNYVGGLVGYQNGNITASYATGNTDGGAEGSDRVGGLVGFQFGGNITASYATGDADGGAGDFDHVGGLVGLQNGGNITASYSFGGIANQEMPGELGTTKPSGVNTINDLTLSNAGDSWNSTTKHTFRAWDFGTTNQPPALKYADYDGDDDISIDFVCVGTTKATTNSTIYLTGCGTFLPGQGRFDIDISSKGAKFDFTNLDNTTDIDRISIEYTTTNDNIYEFSVDTDNNTDFTKDNPYTLVIPPSRIIYYYRIVVERGGEQEGFFGEFTIFRADIDSNGLIEIDSLTQLHNMRYNLKGTSYKTDSSDIGSTIGCPNAGCFGYELTGNLDFDKDGDGSTWSTNDNNGTIEYTLDQVDNVEPYFVVDSGGWDPIGNNTNSNAIFDAIFDGNNHTISSLAMRKDLQYLGMFGVIGANADIRNLGLVANLADYTGTSNNAIHIGGLVGRQNGGSITTSYTKGTVAGGAGDLDNVGGLVGKQDGGSVTASYATGDGTGGAGGFDNVGGLVGHSSGRIIASYATGNADGGDGSNNRVGGLVGNQNGGSITTSYATGGVDGGDENEDLVGGLVGFQDGGSITASYATGEAAGAAGIRDRVGGLVGYQFSGVITASYATGEAAGGTGSGDRVGGLVGEQSSGSITASYATGNAAGGAGNNDRVGGLVGEQSSGSITASYATGNAAGGAGNNDRVGGLVGSRNSGVIITASYATGNADGGTGSGDRVGGLVGSQIFGGITASYSFGQTSNRDTNGQGGKPSGVNTINDLTLSNAGGSWNSTTDNTFRAWDFTTDQPPALKYADYDGATAGKKFACEGAGNTTTDANTIYLPYCESFLPGQGRSPVGGTRATGASIALRYSALVDNDFDGYIEISNLVALGNIIYNPQGTSYKTSTASKGITSGCPRGVCRGYELTRSFSTTELESGGVDHYLRNILTQDAVIKSNGYSIADIYLQE